jgi:hypothetical protein
MKHFLLISCLILCSCFSEEEEEFVNSPSNKPDEPIQFEPCPSPSLNGSVNPDPLILECPPEDISECPVQQPEWGWKFALSVEELPFGKQGEVRCLTSSDYILGLDNYGKDYYNYCREERILVSDSINNPPHFIGINSFKRLICPWFIATRVSKQVLHISVDKNETGEEREWRIGVSNGNGGNSFTITQSAE